MKVSLAKKYLKTNKFELYYYEQNGINEIVIKNNDGGKNFASHTRYNLLDNDGNLISNSKLDRKTADFIFNNFELRGHTSSFEIYKEDLDCGKVNQRKLININESDIIHKLTATEKSFTSTGDKLVAHWPIFNKYKETGFGSIIRATMTLHQVCASHCHYCSTISRKTT